MSSYILSSIAHVDTVKRLFCSSPYTKPSVTEIISNLDLSLTWAMSEPMLSVRSCLHSQTGTLLPLLCNQFGWLESLFFPAQLISVQSCCPVPRWTKLYICLFNHVIRIVKELDIKFILKPHFLTLECYYVSNIELKNWYADICCMIDEQYSNILDLTGFWSSLTAAIVCMKTQELQDQLYCMASLQNTKY